MTKIFLIRHGESMANQMSLFGGHGNFALTQRGLWQAQATAREMQKYSIDVVISSDLQRARRTGEEIAKLHSCPLKTDKAFREMYGGLWECYVFDEIQNDYPEEYAVWRNDIIACTPPEGEPFKDVYARVENALTRIAEEYDGKTVCIASHATPIKCAEALFAGGIEHVRDFNWVSNSSVTLAEFDSGKWTEVFRSYDKHLGDNSSCLPESI